MADSTISQDIRVPSDSDYDRRLMYVVYFLLVLSIVFSTYLHHFQPHVLKVPSNINIGSWQHPTFEQTAIYDRMTEAERQRVLTEGIPQGESLAAACFGDLLILLLSWILFRHASKHYGFWMASCFFIGSFVFTGLEESVWIVLGRFFGGSFSLSPGGVFWGTYWFTKGGMWFVETPMYACLGWFLYAYSCVWVAGNVFKKMGPWTRATVGGLLAMGVDLWADPVNTSPENMTWVWGKGDFFLFFGIPVYNFVGWFLVIFTFAVFWEKLPDLAKRWGTMRCTINFVLICIVGGVVTAISIFTIWFIIGGNLLSLLGVNQVIHLPSGW